MGDKTKIEWCDATWNPLRGCTAVSPGCVNCYAATVAARFSGPGQAYDGLAKFVDGVAKWTGKIRVVERTIRQPLKWKRPRRIFVNSMSDLFHESVPTEVIATLLGVMACAPQHQFLVLTKRPRRMRDVIATLTLDGCLTSASTLAAAPDNPEWPPPNVWLGVSVEDQQRADERIPILQSTPAAVRFLLCEPLLGPLDLPLDGEAGIHWVIVGGESGPHARPMHPEWARGVARQCREACVPFFFKQWGEYAPCERVGATWKIPGFGYLQAPVEMILANGTRRRYDRDYFSGVDLRPWQTMARCGKRAAGRLLDGQEYNELPVLKLSEVVS